MGTGKSKDQVPRSVVQNVANTTTVEERSTVMNNDIQTEVQNNNISVSTTSTLTNSIMTSTGSYDSSNNTSIRRQQNISILGHASLLASPIGGNNEGKYMKQ